jgi:hypothetical protein
MVTDTLTFSESLGSTGGETVPLVTIRQGGWYELLSITREAHILREQEAQHGPVACPNDGEPLLRGPAGELFCPFCGLRPGQW